MKLLKCPQCNSYTLNALCKKCKIETKSAHYKFLRLKDSPKSDPKKVRKN